MEVANSQRESISQVPMTASTPDNTMALSMMFSNSRSFLIDRKLDMRNLVNCS